MSLEAVEVEVSRRSWIGVASMVFCWAVFVVGTLFLPIRFVVFGLVDSISLFGFPVRADQLATIHQDWVYAISGAVGSAAVLLAVALVWRSRGRNLVSGWVTATTGIAVALVTWAAASAAPLSGF